MEANIVIGEVIVPGFIEISNLPKDSNHILSDEDSEMNDSNVGSGVHSDLEILETKDETENSKKKSSAASLHANPLYLSEGINGNSDEVSDSDDEPYVPFTDSEEES